MTYDYLVGVGNPDAHFTDGDTMTESLKKSAMFAGRREQMRELLKQFCKDGGKGNTPLLLLGGELRDVPWYKYAFWQFPKTVVMNSPEAFTGSFSGGQVTATSVDCKKCEANIHVHALNRSGAASLTRFPPFAGGYSGNPSVQFWAEGVINSGNPSYVFNFLGNVDNSSSLLSDNPFGGNGPLRTMTQTYDWNETIKLGDCCKK